MGLTTETIGVVSEVAPTFAHSFDAGKIITTEQAITIADGVAARAPMKEAFEIICSGAARIVTVTNDEIKAAMYQYYQCIYNLTEVAAATPLAALSCEKQ